MQTPLCSRIFSLPRNRRLLLAALLFLLAASLTGSLTAQAPGLDYTNDLPSVERVKAELKGTDESDTLARHAALFNYLLQYTQRIKENRSYSGPYTPGEIRVRNAYSLAAYQIEQAYKQSHTPAEVAAWSSLEGRYEINNALEWIHQLSGAQANAAYHNAETGLAQTYQRHEEKMRQQMRQTQPGNSQPGRSGMPNDAGSVAARRCLELGGSALECLGSGMKTGFLDLFGMSHSPLFQGSSFTGLTLIGQFNSGNGVDAVFSDTTVKLSRCGKLVPAPRAYTIQRRGDEIWIHVKNSSASLSFALGPDGRLRGPASAEVAGRVITGHHQVWVPNPVTPGYYQTQQRTSNRELTPLEAGQYAGQSGLTQNGQTYNMATTTTSSTYVPGSGGGGGHYESVPDYAPKIQACAIGTLAPGPPAALDPGMLTNIANFAGALFGGASNSTDKAAPEMLSPGMRVAGVYSSRGGLKAEFTDAAVVLDCGEAHVRDKYAVERSGGRILIHIQNSGSPFTATVEPDGSFSAPASVTVNGRLVSGMNGDQVAFVSHSETCQAASLLPNTPASSPHAVDGGSGVFPAGASSVAAPSSASD